MEVDRVGVMLREIPLLYPGGKQWLGKRLDDVVEGHASCTLAVTESDLAGLTIETPKGKRRTKLSTIYVG